uniref:Uncharacterized protein n=1 Tax=uncultured bacterium A1Q1_fos_291 TaxID=1256570 RepID=L7VWV6_9BACT|nr:hypothetical protein [uncultured bacterium A1Q1_fos_291]
MQVERAIYLALITSNGNHKCNHEFLPYNKEKRNSCTQIVITHESGVMSAG